MVKLIALIISIVLQFVAAFLALRLTKLTKYRLSWILISVSFVFMAVRRSIDLIKYFNEDLSEEFLITYEWLGVLISFFITAGVILIREIFYSLKRAELERQRSEQRILNAIIQTEEKERKRFAKDLHDGLGPILSTVKMSVTALLQKNLNSPELEILKNTDNAINEAIGSIKEISNNLSPHILSNFGLLSALKSFTEKLVNTGQIEIIIESNIEETRFNNNVEIIMYRALCELINNTIKHADASKINIEIYVYDKNLTVKYHDNGRGISLHEKNDFEQRGMGLKNIKSRLKSINGTFAIQSSENKGFTGIFELKMNP